MSASDCRLVAAAMASVYIVGEVSNFKLLCHKMTSASKMICIASMLCCHWDVQFE